MVHTGDMVYKSYRGHRLHFRHKGHGQLHQRRENRAFKIPKLLWHRAAATATTLVLEIDDLVAGREHCAAVTPDFS